MALGCIQLGFWTATPAKMYRRGRVTQTNEVQGTRPHLAGGAERGSLSARELCQCRNLERPICYLVRTGGLPAEFGLRQAVPRRKFMNRP